MKAAFTRTYNKEVHLTPYSLQAVKTSRHSAGPALDSEYSEELHEDDSQSDEKGQDSVETDAMIKVVFKPQRGKAVILPQNSLSFLVYNLPSEIQSLFSKQS